MKKEKPKRLAAECPECGAAPPVRAYSVDIAAKRDMAPDEPVMTVQCHACKTERRKIVHYEITAAAFQQAS